MKTRMITATYYFDEDIKEELGEESESFEMSSDTTILEMMKEILSIDDDYIKEHYESAFACFLNEICENEIYLSDNEDYNITPLIQKEEDMNMKIGDIFN